MLYKISFEWTKPRKRDFSSTDELKIMPKFNIIRHWFSANLSEKTQSMFIEFELDLDRESLPLFESALGISITDIQVFSEKEKEKEVDVEDLFWPSLHHFLSFLLAIFTALFLFPFVALANCRRPLNKSIGNL